MVKPTDLRVGNLVNYDEDNTIFTVTAIDDMGISVKNKDEETWMEFECFSPIPITEEFLLKMGFRDDSHSVCFDPDNSYWYGKGDFVTHGVSPESNFFRVYRNSPQEYDKRDCRGHKFGKWMVYVGQWWVLSVEYIHEVQNFFYFITKEELPYDRSHT